MDFFTFIFNWFGSFESQAHDGDNIVWGTKGPEASTAAILEGQQ